MSTAMPKPHPLIDVEHWHNRADDARETAETSRNLVLRETMLFVADTYDCLTEVGEWLLAQPELRGSAIN